MLPGLTYQLIRFIADLVLVRTRSDAQLRAGVLALRHQLRVLERRVGKPAWQLGDRLLLPVCRTPGCVNSNACSLRRRGVNLRRVGRRSPPPVGDRSGMIPRHAPRPPLPAYPLSHRPRPGPHPIRRPTPSRGAGSASPAPRSGAEGRQASLAAPGSPPARRLEPALAAIGPGCPATQTGDSAPLAP